MPISEAKRRANAKWNREKSDAMLLRASPEEGQAIREQASREGLSITRYLVQCHAEHIRREEAREPGGE